ncbi:hypothetical protein ABZ904_29190 [Streptomyces sp. NPDC046900]|uniref:hypothetical protein n=1 Tax=Streptomyces sp. NPDC046900 TaxID=3155473 RepID=UPI0033FE3B5C
MLADCKRSLARDICVLEWKAPYCLQSAAEERARADKYRGEVASLLAPQRRGRTRRRGAQAYPGTKEKV